jgi:ArsR family transcriptional regulator
MPKNEFICDCNAVNEELVQKALSAMPDREVIERLSGFYKIIGDATRCKMLFALMQSEMCVCDLANVLSMSKSSISHQLNKMRERGVVKCRREGKEVYYSLDDSHVEKIFTIGFEHIEHIRRCNDEN